MYSRLRVRGIIMSFQCESSKAPDTGEPIVKKQKVNQIEFEKFYPWQEKALEILQGEIDDRHINWFWTREGNVGKTQFSKYYIQHNPDAIYVAGNDNIKKAITTYYKKHKTPPRVIIWDIPRSDKRFSYYVALEQVKNMLFYSGNGILINAKTCHLLVLANSPPEYRKLSRDRWREYQIIQNEAIFQEVYPSKPLTL